MKFELRDRDRRALIGLALALAAFVVVSEFLLPAYDNLAASTESVQPKEDQLMRYRRAILRQGHYAQLLDQVRKNTADAEGRLIRGDNPSIASVEFQSIVEEAAKKVQIDLSQRNVAPARKKDNFFNEITLTLSFESTPNQLATFLAEMRAAPKFVTVVNAQIAPTQVILEAPRKENFEKRLRVNLTLAALLTAAPQIDAGKK